MRLLTAVALLMVVFPAGGCAKNIDCSCAPTDYYLYLHFERPIPAGSQIEICYAGSCATDEPIERQYERDLASVEIDQLGSWLANTGDRVELTVLSPAGEVIGPESLLATQEGGGCCGPAWVLRP